MDHFNWKFYSKKEDCSNPQLQNGPIMVGSDFVINQLQPISEFYDGNRKYKAETIFKHELGHAMGLNHHRVQNKTDMMCCAITKGKNKPVSVRDAGALKRLYGYDGRSLNFSDNFSFR